jgi:hypothetical protein
MVRINVGGAMIGGFLVFRLMLKYNFEIQFAVEQEVQMSEMKFRSLID